MSITSTYRMCHLDKYVETIYRDNKGERLKPSFLIFLAEAAGCPLRDGPIANQTHAERLSLFAPT